MGKEILKQRMAAEIDEQCRHLLETARAEAERLLAETREAIAQDRQAALEHARREKAVRVANAVTFGRWQADREMEAFQEEVCQEVITRIEHELMTLAKRDDFGRVLEVLLAEAVNAYPEYSAVFTSSQWADTCRRWLDRFGRNDVPVLSESELWDGVAVGDPERRVLIRNTLRGRLRRLEPELRRRCRADLFGV